MWKYPISLYCNAFCCRFERSNYGVAVGVAVDVAVAVAVGVDVDVEVGVTLPVPVTVGVMDGAGVIVGGCELRRVIRGATHMA